MPLTPMMPGCPPLTPNGPPYHYSEPIPPAPSSLSTSQSQPAFQQKHQYGSSQPTTHMDLTHPGSSSGTTTMQPSQQQKTHSQFATGSQYQESYPHTQTYSQPLQQQQPQPHHQPQQTQQPPPQHPIVSSSTYMPTVSQTGVTHYTQPGSGLTSQSYQINGTQVSAVVVDSLRG